MSSIQESVASEGRMSRLPPLNAGPLRAMSHLLKITRRSTICQVPSWPSPVYQGVCSARPSDRSRSSPLRRVRLPPNRVTA